MEGSEIREFGYHLRADAVGFATVEDYASLKSPDPRRLLPNARSIVVMGYRELDGPLDGGNNRAAMSCRMATMDLSETNSYLMARFIEDRYQVKAVPILASYPLNMSPETMGLVADLSLRHAAVAAGLGIIGRHNLVIHPRFGTRMIFSAVLSELSLQADKPVTEDLCSHCGLCVEACPSNALDEEGKTNQLKCLRKSQPYGIGGLISFMGKFIGAGPDEQRALLRDPLLMNLYQAPVIGFHYHCFRCMAVCPACRV